MGNDSWKLLEHHVFYTAACRDVLGKWNTAIHHYIKYLDMNHDSAEMNTFARERPEALNAYNRKKMSEGLAKMIDAIIKEIKNNPLREQFGTWLSAPNFYKATTQAELDKNRKTCINDVLNDVLVE